MAKLKLTPELIEKMIPAIEIGNYIETGKFHGGKSE